MCHPFLLAGTVSSLLSQKILFEGIKLDCALTLMLEGKKSPNYTCTFLHPQKKKKQWVRYLETDTTKLTQKDHLHNEVLDILTEQVYHLPN